MRPDRATLREYYGKRNPRDPHSKNPSSEALLSPITEDVCGLIHQRSNVLKVTLPRVLVDETKHVKVYREEQI